MVGTSPTSENPPRAPRISSPSAGSSSGRQVPGCVGERAVERLDLGPVLMDGGEVSFDRLPVAPLDRTRQLEVIFDDATHQRHERLRWCACYLDEVCRRPV